MKAKNNQFKKDLIVIKDLMSKKIIQNIDMYKEYNNPQEIKELNYIVAAIYITYKNMFPELSVYIPFRVKSNISYEKNHGKELMKKDNIISKETIDKSLSGVEDDIFAMTIVLNHIDNIDETIRKIEKYEPKPDEKEIEELKELLENRMDSVNYAHRAYNVLYDSNSKFSEEEYYKNYIGLLDYLERNSEDVDGVGDIPYGDLVVQVKRVYERKKKNESFEPSVGAEKIEELKSLLDELTRRKDDRIQRKILSMTVKQVFDNRIIKDLIGIGSEYKKSIKKDNGFVSEYYNLTMRDNKKMEMQLQSEYRYKDSKDGNSFHSGIKGKELNIANFFELVDENDEKPVNFYVNELDKYTTNNQYDYNSKLPGETKQQEEERIRKYRQEQEEVNELKSHVRLKESVYKIQTRKYLEEYAKAQSAEMYVCSSAHTTYDYVANINHKGSIEAFTELLRKKDKITIPAQMLLDELAKGEYSMQDTSSSKQINISTVINYFENKEKLNADR